MMRAIEIPVIPDGDTARQWAQNELADPVYAAATPSAFDRFAVWVVDTFTDLFSGQTFRAWGWDGAAAIITITVVVVVVVVALLIWGIPRGRGRSHANSSAVELFGELEHRSSSQLHAIAKEHAALGEWNDAIVFGFRATAREATERGTAVVLPGSTAQAFARSLAASAPAIAETATEAANSFDDVRYLRRTGTEQMYRLIADLDDQARRIRAAVAVS